MVSNLRLITNAGKKAAAGEAAQAAQASQASQANQNQQTSLLAQATCTAILYTVALNVFRQHGPSLTSYAALQKAILRNPHVAIFAGDDQGTATSGSAIEARDYMLCARDEWAAVPGAIGYLLEIQSDLEAQIQARGLYQLGT